MAAAVRAALYLRVSTGRQADNDLSIPDQRRQANGYCASRGWEIVADYVEPGASATDDRRPEFQRMIDAATAKPPAFDVILVHSFSRFFRDQFQLEFYVRRLAKNGVRLVSITQELGDDPMSNMIRQIMALFDEYQSKENAKHTLRAMKENARQGFWNGSLPPIGYRIVEAAEQHGHRTKKILEIDPIQAETVRLIFRLAREGDGTSGPMGVKSITKHLNAAGIRTRDGGRWGIGAVHKGADAHDLHRPPSVQHQVLEDTRAQAGCRSGGDGRAADHRRGRVRGGAGVAQDAQPGAHRAAYHQRPNTAHWNLLLRRLRNGDDAADREERAIPLLHLLNQGPPGRNWLPGPHHGADGQARPRRG
jgi:DNA invertase Pin-like site-specific DNA recombinase